MFAPHAEQLLSRLGGQPLRTGKDLRALRLAAGVGVRALCREAGICLRSLIDYELGRSTLRYGLLLAALNVLGYELVLRRRRAN